MSSLKAGTVQTSVPLDRCGGYLHNSGKYNEDALPESYLDPRSITAGRGQVSYVSSPTSLGQLTRSGDIGELYLNDIKSSGTDAVGWGPPICD
jgi:hypothetical protein